MKRFSRLLALLLTVLVWAGCALAEDAASEAEEELRWQRLYSFTTEDMPDPDANDLADLYVYAEDYEQEKLPPTQDYTLVETLYLQGVTQAQFEEILLQVPNFRRLCLTDCTIEDYSPLLPVSAQLTLELCWQPALPELLAVLPDLYAVELNNLPDEPDFSSLGTLASRLILSLEWEPNLLERLTALPGLKGLKLDDVPDDTDLSYLAEITGLAELTMWIRYNPDIDKQSMPVLPEMPALRSLAFSSAGYSLDSFISDLPDLPALEFLETNADIDPALLRHTPGLRVLRIPGAEDFSRLSELQALEELYIGLYLPEDLSPLYDLPALRLLEIDANAAYPVVEYVDQLEQLHEASPNIEIRLYYCC